MRGEGTIPEQALLVIVDESGRRLDRPELAAVVGNMVRVQLAPLPGLMLPVVLKLRQGAMSELDAYAFDNRCLRVLLPAGIMRDLGRPELPMRVVWELRTRVADLAANFRSRIGARGNFFRQATRAHHVVVRTGRLSRDRDLTPTPMWRAVDGFNKKTPFKAAVVKNKPAGARMPGEWIKISADAKAKSGVKDQLKLVERQSVMCQPPTSKTLFAMTITVF